MRAAIPFLSNQARKTNVNNPKGFFEFAPAKKLARENGWMPEAVGKAIKIIVQLLWRLPMNRRLNYRVVLMERDLEEILDSQDKLLIRQLIRHCIGPGASARD